MQIYREVFLRSFVVDDKIRKKESSYFNTWNYDTRSEFVYSLNEPVFLSVWSAKYEKDGNIELVEDKIFHDGANGCRN